MDPYRSLTKQISNCKKAHPPCFSRIIASKVDEVLNDQPTLESATDLISALKQADLEVKNITVLISISWIKRNQPTITVIEEI